MADLKFNRIVLKLSGEALAGDQGYGIDPETIQSIAQQIKCVHELGVELCLVVGGGNIWRGLSGSAKGIYENLMFWKIVNHIVANCEFTPQI